MPRNRTRHALWGAFAPAQKSARLRAQGGSLFAVLLVVLTCAAASQAPERATLVPESGPRYSFRHGALEIRGGGGWLRTSGVYLNFRLTFEFKARTPEVDAGVLIRTWTGDGAWPGTGYRLRLPIDSAMLSSAVFVGHGMPVAVVEEGHVVLKPADEWQQVEITGEGRRIRCVMNGVLVGTFDIDSYGGHILFDNKKGLVELRNINISSMEIPFEMPNDLITGKELKAAGGQMPKLIREVKPRYTSKAMRRIVQGRVDLEVVVLPDGSTGVVRIKHSLDPDLDLSAIAAVRAWKFEPALVKGKPTSMLVDVNLTFTLK